MAGVLGVQEQPGQALAQTLAGELRSKELLLVLDNCEHLVDAAAPLVDVMLGSCPRMRVLATSREALDVAGEVRRIVPSLSVPTSQRSFTAEELAGYESARLFVERASDRHPGFAPTAENAGTLAEICQRLDGVPLAIELAAARVGTLSVEQISERLENSLKLLTGGGRTAVPRQRTLRATLDWSHELLGEQERSLFRRLSTFVGGWTLEAAHAVGAGVGIDEEDVLDLLSGLVNKSLVASEVTGHVAARYRMLEPVRQYALEKLEVSGEAEVIGRRHAAFFLALAEQAEPQLRRQQQAAWFERLDTELDNLRAALYWSLRRGETELGLRLCGALHFFWMWRGNLREGRRWIEQGLAKGGDATASVRANALIGLGEFAILQSDYQQGSILLEQSLALYREAGDGVGIAGCLCDLGWLAALQGDYKRATEQLEASIARCRELGDELILAFALTRLARLAMLDTDYSRSTALLDESLRLYREAGDGKGIGLCLEMFGYTAIQQGDYERATKLIEEGIAQYGEAGTTVEASSLTILGLAVMLGGDHGRAAELIAEGLVVGRELGNNLHIVQGIETAATLAASQAKGETAAKLWGAADESRAVIGAPSHADDRVLHEPYMAFVRTQLGEKAWNAAWEQGREITFDEAVDFALSTMQPNSYLAEQPTDEQPTTLTRREKEIAMLVARGFINRQIASELSISEHTAATHIRRILKKLGLRSRTELAAWITEQ